MSVVIDYEYENKILIDEIDKLKSENRKLENELSTFINHNIKPLKETEIVLYRLIENDVKEKINNSLESWETYYLLSRFIDKDLSQQLANIHFNLLNELSISYKQLCKSFIDRLIFNLKSYISDVNPDYYYKNFINIHNNINNFINYMIDNKIDNDYIDKFMTAINTALIKYLNDTTKICFSDEAVKDYNNIINYIINNIKTHNKDFKTNNLYDNYNDEDIIRLLNKL